MTQTATFPNLESLPNVSTQAILYFSSTMGTLTEVDLVTSGSYSTEFHAENLGPSSTTIKGTTSANVSINVPSGAIPVTIPSITESFNASPFEGTLDYGGTSGKDFASVTSNSTSQTMILTSPADLAAFTGSFRIPVTVTGHATGSASAGNGDLSAGFNTQTSATITVIYHFIPNLPSLDPPSDTSPSLQPPSVPSSAASPASSSTATNTAPGASSLLSMTSSQSHTATAFAKKKGHKKAPTSFHKVGHHAIGGHLRPKSGGDSHAIKSHSLHKI
jgi:hypothetical protein